MLKKFIIALAVVTASFGYCEANTPPPPPQFSCNCKGSSGFTDEQFDSLKEAAYYLGAEIRDRKTFSEALRIAETISKEFVVFFWCGYYGR